MPPLFFLAVNIPLFWVGAPMVALFGRRHPLVELTFYGVIFTNAIVHIAPFLAGQGYNPGLLTAIILFLPVSAWVAHTCFGNGKLRYKAMALLVADGLVLHIILIGSMMLFIRGEISGLVLVVVQVVNAVLFVLIPWYAEKWRGEVLAKTT